MISVGARDARKGLGLGFGGGGASPRRDMEDTELEEGEAYTYHSNHNNDDDDASIDPDIDLSYIDEKIQDVLGHYQKDFEGGVSAENLGSKFGGYGSFLPVYQRSPTWSQRTPPKFQSCSTSRSPNNFHLEGGHCNSVVSSTAPQSGGRGPASTSSTSLPAVKTSSVSDPGKQVIGMPENRVEESAPRLDSKNKKYSSASDQKTLKVRIKVGTDNLSTRKNAAIYSGLGLDDSPSSSLDDSPSESEGLSHEHQDIPFESPTSILQIMIPFPVDGGLLLSPLHDDFINLMEKGKLLKDARYVPFPRGGMETSGIINGSDTMKMDGKIGEKNIKSVEKNDHSAESKSENDKDARMRDVSRKEAELDALACDELVSNTLKLPILSNSYSTTSDVKRSREVNKSVLKDYVLSDRGEEKQMESTLIQEDDWVEKQKSSSVGKVLAEGKESSIHEISAHPNKEGPQKGEKLYDLGKSDSNVAKARKVSNTEGLDSSKQKTNKKVTSHGQENTRLPHGKEKPFPGEKKKSKRSHGNVTAEAPKDSARVGSSMPKTKKSTTENCMSNSDVEHVKSRKDVGKTMDTYKDFFGDIEEEDNPMDLSETPADKLKESDAFPKSKSVVSSVAKDRPSAKKIEKTSTTEAGLLIASSPRSGNGNVSDAAPPGATAAPVLIEENWVGCDKCQKWRLLPIGTNPDHLPEKWLCSMLNWLPGMNRCSFTEEETNNALIALYQAPVPESQTNPHSNPGGLFTGATLANFRHPDQIQRNCSGKKKNGLKVMSNAVNKESPTQLSNSTKKNIQPSAKSRSLNDVNNSPLVNESEFQQLSKCNNLSVENQRQKYKEKNRADASAGDSKNSKMKSRRDSDHDSSRASKKFKSEPKNTIDEGWASDHSGAVGKVGPSSSGGFPTSSAGKDQAKHSERSFSKDSKFDVKDRLQVSISKVKVKDEVSLANGSLDLGNTEAKDSLRKRKNGEAQNGSYPTAGRHPSDSMPFVNEEFSDNDYRKEKKLKISRSEGKQSSASKGNSKPDKKRSHAKNQMQTQDHGSTQQNLDGLDLSKRDLTSRQASVAATSSSSKVSGSHKTKSSFQELKGSPVESVSSSPMRISNPDKFTSVGRDASMKDERSPKRYSDSEDLGRIDHSRAGKTDNPSNTAHDLECPSQDFAHASSSKARRHIAPSPDITNHHCTNGALDISGQDTRHPGKPVASDHFGGEEKHNESHYHANGYQPRKSMKSKLDKSRSFKSEVDAVKVRSSDVSELHDCSPSGEVKTRDGKKKLQEKLVVKYDEIEEKVSGRKDITGKQLNDAYKRESRLNSGGDGIDTKVDATCRKDALSTSKQNILPESNNDERSSKRVVSDKPDQVETVSSGERSVLLPPSGGPPLSDTLHHGSQLGTGSHKGNGGDASQVDASNGDNAQKVQKQIRKADNQNRSQQITSRHPTKNGQRARDIEVPSPIRRDLPSHAATNALKEAKDLKHMADRLKSAGSSHERTELYFRAALKFLHGASLLESSSSESTNHNDIVRSRQTYSETAKLCEFCAYEYEKSKDMAAAALAYKCTEVAYMRVVYSSHGSASRDRNELQAALQLVPHGESPSSSASDVDNLNNHTAADKVALPKGVSSPQVAANHVIAARNRPNFVRLLNFAQDVTFAMEASRKSWVAFAAASGNTAEAKYGEGISSIKRALDFNFQDVDGLLRLVRLAMEVKSR